MRRISSRKIIGILSVVLVLIVAVVLRVQPSQAATPGSWTFVGLSGYTLNSMAVDPNDPDILYAGAAGNGIFKSLDGGANWTAVNNGPGLSTQTVFALVIDPSDSNIVYAGGSELQGGGAGLFKSTDAGANWTLINSGIVDVGFNGPPSFTHSMVMDPNNSSILYLALGVHCGAVYKTVDAAASWTRTDGGACDPVALQVDPNNSNIVYASATGGPGVWKSQDAGQTWNIFFGPSFNTLAIDPLNTSTLYGSSHMGGVSKSTDGGASWADIGSPGGIYRALITDSARPNTVFMGQLTASTNSVYVSRDSGSTWDDIGGALTGTGVRFLVRPANDNNVLYALTDSGLYSYGIIDPVPTHQVTGTVYIDANNNGIKDNGEQGYEGATVHLFSGPGSGLNMTDVSDTTNPNGVYTITGVDPTAENYLKIDVPSGYLGTTVGISGVGFFTGGHTHDFGIGSPPVLPTVFSDNFTDADGTPLTTHNNEWTAFQSMPEIRSNNLHTTAPADPVGPYAYVLTDQCMSIDIQTPTQGILALHARQDPGGAMGGYGSDFNTNPSINYYEVSLYKATNGDRYFPGGFSIPKAMIGSAWHNFKLCTIGDRISSYLDNALMVKATDTDWTQGVSHFGLSGNNFADNFKIEGLLVGPPPPPVYAVNTNTRNTFGNNNVTATIGATGIPAGDTATVSVATGTFAGATGCSDSKGNTYAVAADRNSGQGRIFVCTSHLATALTAGDTVTATYPAFSGVSVVSVNAITAAASNGVVTAASSANGNSATPNSGSITVGGPTVLFGVVAHNSTPTLTPGPEYTLVGQVSGGTGSGKRTLSPEFRLVSSAGSYNANATISNGGQFWQAAIVGYSGN